MRFIVGEQERGFLFKKGQFVKMLNPGSHSFWFGEYFMTVQKALLARPLHEVFSPALLAVFRKDVEFSAQTVTQDVPDGKLALHYVDGRLQNALPAGFYTFWNVAEKHTFTLMDITEPEVKDLPLLICQKLHAQKWLVKLSVGETQKGILLFNQQFQRLLEPGEYYFWNTATKPEVVLMETRRQELALNGQEILTKDKVELRMNFVCSYRITDCLKAYQEIADVKSQFYIAVQLVLRDYAAGLTLDELLTQRSSIQEKLLELIRPKAEVLYIEVADAGIKDIILPGDMREIMNTVLLAEKRAQANVITRREEVASTRSLLNTAKLMDENKTLYKLKELEYLEKICENVGNISVSGGDLLEHLRAIIGSAPEDGKTNKM